MSFVTSCVNHLRSSSNVGLIRSSLVSNQMMNYGVKHVGVVGAGQMGTGIAIVAAMNAKKKVTIVDANQDQLEKSKKFTESLLSKYVSKGKMSEEEKNQVKERMNLTTDLNSFKDSDFVIEAIVENSDVKTELFKKLSQITPKDAILASNTSSIPITTLANSTDRPDQVIGMHFMNPVPVMKLVEVIQGDHTGDKTLTKTLELCKEMNKETSSCLKDSPGFIANRILMPYINEAVITLEEGIATVEDIDKTMVLGTNVPMGPLTLADFIGLDTCLYILNVLHQGLKNDKYKPSALLEKMVNEGKLGKKSGEGFYKY